jgi:hypothetical protein
VSTFAGKTADSPCRRDMNLGPRQFQTLVLQNALKEKINQESSSGAPLGPVKK